MYVIHSERSESIETLSAGSFIGLDFIIQEKAKLCSSRVRIKLTNQSLSLGLRDIQRNYFRASWNREREKLESKTVEDKKDV